ncbi:MAG: T9SS type A sorting domain-containing protein, partial [bacterium]|nr:T9SS type A sorting domain-containing protein [bacterium]
ESQEKVESILYPSPAKDFIHLKTEYRGEYSLNIFSSSGRLCYASSGVLSEGEIEVDLKPCNLKPGVYFYALTIENRIIKGKFGVVK